MAATTATSPATTVDRIKRAAAIGLEVSTITNIIARFATGTPIHLADPAETNRCLHKYREKLPFLGALFQPGESLQATIVCDLLLSLANNVRIAGNVFEVLQKLWPSCQSEATGNGSGNRQQTAGRREIGYFAFLQNAVDAMRQHQQYANDDETDVDSMQSMLSEDFLIFDRVRLSDWLKREQLFRRLRRLRLDDVQTIEQLNELQLPFKQLRTLDASNASRRQLIRTAAPVHLFDRVLDFIRNTWRLLSFIANGRPPLTPTEILQIDVYDAVGRMVLDQRCSPLELESMVSAMNMNLPHVIAVNLSGRTYGSARETMASVAVRQLLESLEKRSGTLFSEQRTVRSSEKHDDDDGGRLPQTLDNTEMWAYLSKVNGMLSHLLYRLLGSETLSVDHLDRMVQLQQIHDVSLLFGKSSWRAALRYDFAGIADVCVVLQSTTDYA